MSKRKRKNSQGSSNPKRHQNKSKAEREFYLQKTANAPDFGDTDPDHIDNELVETEKQINSIPGISAGGEGRHRIDLDGKGQESFWSKHGNAISAIISVCSLLLAVGTVVHYQGKYSSDLEHTQRSLEKIEKSSEERRNFLVGIDKRLFSVEDKMKVLEKIDNSSSLMAKDLIALKTVVEELRSGKDTDIDKYQSWTEQQLAKLERRVDALWDSRSPN